MNSLSERNLTYRNHRNRYEHVNLELDDSDCGWRDLNHYLYFGRPEHVGRVKIWFGW